MAAAGVEPRVMGIGPVPATRKLLARLGLKIEDFDAIELNEAFASQSLAVMRALGLPDDASHVNPNARALALGNPRGTSGARPALTLELGPPACRASVCAYGTESVAAVFFTKKTRVTLKNTNN